jgi:hypothetical protein
MNDKNQTGWMIAGGVGLCVLVAAARFSAFFTHPPHRQAAAVESQSPTQRGKSPSTVDDVTSSVFENHPPMPTKTLARPTETIVQPLPAAELKQNAGMKPKPVPVAALPSPLAHLSRSDKPVPEPFARAALSFVGMDAEAEVVWASTINDPSVDPKTRKDLIEDLNEDGFPDPKHLSADDLPLILKRIELIENHAPLSMDEVNAAAFQEAYKDLLDMAEKAARG